jgi:hypothetical protein
MPFSMGDIMKKILSFVLLTLIFSSNLYAEGFREASASLLLPTTGQAMNGQLSDRKTKIMAGVEVAAITTVTIIGFAAGGPAVWFGAAPLLANHVWSASDAYKNAQYQQDPIAADQQQIMDAQRSLELSRQNRFEREQAERYDVRERVRRAGEQAYYS